MWKYLFLALSFIAPIWAQRSTDYWVDADYLLWFIKENPVPAPLATSASFEDSIPGAIGQPHTRVILGKKAFGMGWMQGFQADAGFWAGDSLGIEGRYFLLPPHSRSKSLNTSGNPGSPNYAVPIYDASGVFGLNGTPGETIFLLPGPISGDPGFAGAFKLQLTSKLQGAEINALYRMIDKDSFQLECLGGLFWVELHEKLAFKALSRAAPGSGFGSAFYNFTDRFECSNDFLAADLGFDARYRFQKWHLKAKVKGALGAALQNEKIEGFSQTSSGNVFFLTAGTGNEILPGGVFAEPSNRGTHKRNPFAVAFETKIQTGLEITQQIEIHLGYSFLWISSVLRPGNQIDRKINSTRTALADASRETVGIGPGPIPFGGASGPAPLPTGPIQPRAHFKRAPFWAQGLDLGMQFHF